MKRQEFQSMIKEIVREVMNEMSKGTTPEETTMQERETPAVTAKQHSQYPKSDPAGTEGGQSSDQKIGSRNAAWKSWGDKMKMLKGIHDEPEFKAKKAALRGAQSRGDQLDADRAATGRGND